MVLYRTLLSLAALPFLVGLLVSGMRGRSRWEDIAARLGRGPGPAQTGGIWLHAASVGELTAARPLLDALREADPACPLLITCNSATGKAVAQGWSLPNSTVCLAPLDLRWAVRSVLRQHQPKLLISLENELWPNRFALAGAPVALVSARVSARAASRWSRLPRFAARVLKHVTLAAPQDAGSEERLLRLGLPRGALAPRILLKAAVAQDACDPKELDTLSGVFDRTRTLLAASTHAPEEAMVLEAFAELRGSQPDMRLILAPRHPNRGDEIADLIKAKGWVSARRSLGALPTSDTKVYLADTLGEMPLWYALSSYCFVGGSWSARGGHTPFEPAAAGCAIFHGPDTANFAEPYAALAKAEAAQEVADPQALAQAVLGADAKAMADRAQQALADLAPNEALEQLARQLLDLKGDPHVHPTRT